MYISRELTAAVVCGVLLTGNAMAQPDTLWTRCLGGTGVDNALSIAQTNDAGFITAGFTESNNGDVTGYHGGGDVWVAKQDAAGGLQWAKSLGGSNIDEASSVQQTTDGGYIIAGRTRSSNGDVSGQHGMDDGWLVKLDGAGTIEWQRCLGGSGTDYLRSVKQTADGGYVVAGGANSTNGDVHGGHGFTDAWVVKLDAGGDTLWTKCLGGSSDDELNTIMETSDGGYFVAGYTGSEDGDASGNHGAFDYWVARLDPSGSIIWQQCLGGSGLDVAYSASLTNEGGVVVTGYAYSTNGDVSGHHGDADAWMVKLDGTGSLLWAECLGGSSNDVGYSVATTSDGGSVVAAKTSSINGDVSGYHGGFSDGWVLKLDPDGDLLWQRCLGGSNSDQAWAVEQTADGGYAVAGQSWSTDGDVHGLHGSMEDAWVVRFAAEPVSVHELGKPTFDMAPNPTSGRVTINFDPTVLPNAIRLVDPMGRVLIEQRITNTHGPMSLDIGHLSNGPYVVEVFHTNAPRAMRTVLKR